MKLNLSALSPICLAIACLVGFPCPVIAGPLGSVDDEYRAVKFKQFPKPPFDFPAPRLPVGKEVTKREMAATDLLAEARDFAEQGQYKKAAQAQYRAVQEGATGRYDLACYLSLAGESASAFYWLEVAAMREGFRAEFAGRD